MKIKLIATGIVLAAAALTVNARISGNPTAGPGATVARPSVKPLTRHATQWNEFGIRYKIHDYESAGKKPLKVTVTDLGPNFTPMTQDLAPNNGYVDVNGVQYNLLLNATNGKLTTTIPTSAFNGGGDSLFVTCFDRNGTQLGCFSFGYFF